MEEQKNCPKDCKLCTFQQHAYCAAQLAYNNMMSLQALSARMDALEKSQENFLSDKKLIDPLNQEIAQIEGGAV